MSPDETVTAFIRAIEAKDLDAAMALLADDVEYDNVPMPTVHGVDKTRTLLDSFVATSDEVEWVVHRQIVDGRQVMNERTDRFRSGDRWVEIPVAGIWEVVDGRITLWRDYFDLQGMMDQLAGESPT
jgi:limonene-1,2-epoxide hydrolase